MARLRRRRRLVKWITGSSSLMLLSMLLASVWYQVSYIYPLGTVDRAFGIYHNWWLISFEEGSFVFGYCGASGLDSGLPGLRGLTAGRNPSPKVLLQPDGWWLSEEEFEIFLPLWIPFVVLALPTAYLFWRDRRIPPHCCLSCGYDLTGNTSGVCPECGQQIGSDTSSRVNR